MSKKVLSLISIFISLVLVFASANNFYAQSGGDASYVDGELLVKFKPGVSNATKDNIHNSHGSQLLKRFPSSPIDRIKLDTGLTVEQANDLYNSNSDVKYAEPNYIYENQVLQTFPDENIVGQFIEQWSLHNEGQTGGAVDADIDVPEAWSITTGSSDVVVAIIDTGVNYNHPDLAANMWVNPGESGLDANGNDKRSNGIDDDLNGYVDDVHGISTKTGASEGDPMDILGHGTSVAGVIGAVGNNGTGIAGINWNVKILACEKTVTVECLNYVKMMKDRGVNIVATNNSYVGSNYSSMFKDAIDDQRDILFIAASGNESKDNDMTPRYPASYQLPNVISVSASNKLDESIYNYGRTSVHISAPGTSIFTTTISNYDNKTGTSFSAPHVTGIAALLKAQDPSRSWIEIRNLILAGGDSLPDFYGLTISGKRVNAYGSLDCSISTLLSPLYTPLHIEVGKETNLSAFNIDCDSSYGTTVNVSSSGGDIIDLFDGGANGDLIAGDGIFSALWSPVNEADSLTFSSLLGTEIIDSYIYSPPVPWVYDSGGDDNAMDMAIDGAGNVYVIGSAGTAMFDQSGTIQWIDSNMTGIAIAVDSDSNIYTLESNRTVKYDSGRIEQWSQTHVWTPADIETDSTGNVYVTGNLNNTIYTTKYDTNGSMVWPFEQTQVNARANAIAVDQHGNVYLTGEDWSQGPTFIFATKFDTDGNLVAPWPIIKQYGLNPQGRDITVDINGHVFIAGKIYFKYHYAIILEYDENGQEVWIEENLGARYGVGIDVDTLGNVYFTGDKYIYNSQSGDTDYNILTSVFNSNRDLVWSRLHDHHIKDTSRKIMFDTSGKLYVLSSSSAAHFPSIYDYVVIPYQAPCIDEDGDGFGNTQSCPNGPFLDCNDSDQAINPGAADSFCDGVDNNCNGSVDEDYIITATNCGVGACSAAGQLECIEGSLNDTCTPGSPTETPEQTCTDRNDNDCDGLIDFIDTADCGPPDCSGYTRKGDCNQDANCKWNKNQRICEYHCTVTETPEITCNDGLDNDCDDLFDNADSDCISCIPTGNPDDNCDGVDDDCNGTADDAYVPAQTNCGTGECAATGQLECQGGTEVDTCSPGSPQTEGPEGDQTCSDSLDNDCDGDTDILDADCVCIPTGNPDDNCDGIDDDCNGTADDAYMPTGTSCGTGECASTGQLACQGGSVVDTCSPGAPQNEGPEGDPTCSDSIDNDCDGLIDTIADPDCQAPSCSDYTNKPECTDAGCRWKKGSCT